MSFQTDRKENLIGGLDLDRAGLEFPSALGPVLANEAASVTYARYRNGATAEGQEDWLSSTEWPLEDGSRFAYVIASHVIQHVPNPIGWLNDIASRMTDDGILSLAIPDKRYTFDLKRPLSTTGQLVEAHIDKHKRPSIAQMFDNCRMAVIMNAQDAWAGAQSAPSLVGEVALPLAYEQAVRQAQGDDYIDSTCWIFTPTSFLDIIEDLIRLTLLPLEVDRFVPTVPGTVEFLVRLRRAGANPLDSIRLSREIVWRQERSNLLR